MPLIRRYSRRLGASGLVSMSALSLAAPVFLRGGAALASEPATVGALNALKLPASSGRTPRQRPPCVLRCGGTANGEGDFTMIVGDAPLTFDNLVFTEVYVRAVGAWKLVAVHFSRGQ
jgi:hypothetical protein